MCFLGGSPTVYFSLKVLQIANFVSSLTVKNFLSNDMFAYVCERERCWLNASQSAKADLNLVVDNVTHTGVKGLIIIRRNLFVLSFRSSIQIHLAQKSEWASLPDYKSNN